MPPGQGGHLQNAVQALDVLLGEIGPVVIQEIAVIRRQRVGVEGVVHAGRLHRRREVGAADGVAGRDGVQRAGGGQGGHLVVGKGEHICAILQVAQQNVLAVGFALGLVGNLKAGLSSVLGLEGGENLLKEGFVLLRAPNRQGDGLIGRLAAAGRLVPAAAAGQQGQHPDRQNQ